MLKLIKKYRDEICLMHLGLFDRRKKIFHKGMIALIAYGLTWTLAMAQTSTIITGHEHTIFGMSYEALTLLGVIQALISYIYLSGQKDTKATLRKIETDLQSMNKLYHDDIKDLQEKKMDRAEHDRICDGQGE